MTWCKFSAVRGLNGYPEYFKIACARVAPDQEQPDVILTMPKSKPEEQPDLFSFTAA